MLNDYRYTGEYNSKKKRNIQEVVEYILDKPYGSTIDNADLAHILQYNIDDEEEYHKYKSIMSRVRNFLLQYGYVLKSIAGIGYYILRPSQITNHCYKTYVKRASRLYDKSDFILGRVDRTELNEDRLEELENMMELNKKLIDEILKTITESKYYSRKNYYDNLEE